MRTPLAVPIVIGAFALVLTGVAVLALVQAFTATTGAATTTPQDSLTTATSSMSPGAPSSTAPQLGATMQPTGFP